MHHNRSADTGKPLPRAQVRAYEATLQHVSVNAPVVDWPRPDHTFANAVRRCMFVQPAFATSPTTRATQSWPRRHGRTGRLTTRWRAGPTRARPGRSGSGGTAQWAAGQMAPCPRRTPATVSLDEAEVLPGTRPRVLTGRYRQKRRNEATRRGADGRCPMRLSWTRLSGPRRV